MRLKGFVAILSFVLFAAAVSAQTQTTGTLHCTQATDVPKPMDAGDAPGHMMGLGKSICTWSKPMEIAGVKSKDGTSVTFDEMAGAKYSGLGTHVSTMENGDKLFVKFQGGGTLKDDKLVSDGGNWSYTGGTGKMKGIKGKGTYKGKANPDGSLDYEIAGDYTLPSK